MVEGEVYVWGKPAFPGPVVGHLVLSILENHECLGLAHDAGRLACMGLNEGRTASLRSTAAWSQFRRVLGRRKTRKHS